MGGGGYTIDSLLARGQESSFAASPTAAAVFARCHPTALPTPPPASQLHPRRYRRQHSDKIAPGAAVLLDKTLLAVPPFVARVEVQLRRALALALLAYVAFGLGGQVYCSAAWCLVSDAVAGVSCIRSYFVG